MIQVQLKAKHFYIIAEILFGNAAYVSFTTLEKIKGATTGIGDEDLATVEIDTNMFIEVFRQLTTKPEGQFNQVNTEMMVMLTPQIEAGVAAGDPDWINIAQSVQSIREANWAVVDNMIATGKQRLFA